MKRCSWTLDSLRGPDGIWVTSCGYETEVETEEMEICPNCRSLVEHVEIEEVLEEDEAFVDDTNTQWGSKARPATPEWSAAMEPLCKSHHWAALSGLDDWYRCQICGADAKLDLRAQGDRSEHKHQWTYGIEGETRRCRICDNVERLNRIVKEGEVHGQRITWNVSRGVELRSA